MKHMLVAIVWVLLVSGCTDAEDSAVTQQLSTNGEIVSTTVRPEAQPFVGPVSGKLEKCTYLQGDFVIGRNALGSADFSTVTCPEGTFAMTNEATWGLWFATSACQPIGRRFSATRVATDWFSTPAGVGTGCEGNRLATATMCCVP